MEQCMPNTATFLRVCVFCIDILGYPCHWIGFVLDELLSTSSHLSTQQQLLKTKAHIPGETLVVYCRKTTDYRGINISSFAIKIEQQIKLWCLQFGNILMPLEKIREPEDPIYMYQLELGSNTSNPGGVSYPMVLGFVLSRSKTSVEDTFQLIFQGSHIKGAIRKNAIEKGSSKCHVFSCMTFDCNLADKGKSSVSFFISQQTFDRFKNHYVAIFRTDSWSRLGFAEVHLSKVKRLGLVLSL
jgi:hypothetical protein